MEIKENRFIDDKGRHVILRGCNAGGSSKLPSSPQEASCQGTGSLKNPEAVSFVNRPFPLEEAEEHFIRLKKWGMTFLRLVITWEALEHEGPEIYDESYLAYLRKLLLIAEKTGVSVFLDPHQDVWSRWTGGDGAPAWTLEKTGFDLEKIDQSGAAVTQQHYRELVECKAYWRKNNEIAFFWPVNYSRYGAATMFTLFFGGNTYAPEFKIENKPAQDWLQDHYIAAFRHCMRRLKNCSAIAGWGIMNEPHPGFISCTDIMQPANSILRFGPVPNPFQAMAAASGYSVRLDTYSPLVKAPLKKQNVILNPQGIKLFREGFFCPWKQAGVWTDKEGIPKLLKKDHFSMYQGRPAVFTDDFLKPFTLKFIEKIKEAERPCFFFIEGVAGGDHQSWGKKDGEGIVNAFHQYDGPTLFLKSFNPHFTGNHRTGKIILGRKNVASFWADELGHALDWSREKMGNMPCLLGEFGLPFNMKKGKAYKTGNYKLHEEALSLYYDGVDKYLLNSTIWNYTSDNTHEKGDLWNGEDFSIFHRGEGRAAPGWLRPYPMATAGKALLINWDRKKRIFVFHYIADSSINADTEIFVPEGFFGTKPDVKIICQGKAELTFEYKKNDPDVILIHNDSYNGKAEITVSPGN